MHLTVSLQSFHFWPVKLVGGGEFGAEQLKGIFRKTYPDRPCRELCIFLLVSDNEHPPNSPLDKNALRKGSSQVEGLPVLVLDAMEIMENAGFCV